MADLPRHPEGRDGAEGVAGGPSGVKRPWVVYAVGVVLAALLLLMIVLHLTGAVGAGAH